MGGLGSGRARKNGLPTEFYRLDVRWLQRRSFLVPGCTRALQMRREGGDRAQLWTVFNSDRLTVDFDLGRDLFGRRRSRFELRVRWSKCYYGGRRPWLVCPQEACGRGVAILYGKEDFFCRRCRGVTYPLQRVPARSRDLARAQMCRIRLGGSGDMTDPFPERPKGMHEWTYTRLACRAVAAEYKASNTLLAHFDRSKRAAADASAESAGKLQGSDGVEARVSKQNSCFPFDLDETPGKSDTPGGGK